MVSKSFVHQALFSVYKEALEGKTPADEALAAEVREIASDERIFSPEQITDNLNEFKAIEDSVKHRQLVCYVDGGVDTEFISGDRLVKAAGAYVVYHDETLVIEGSEEIPSFIKDNKVNAHAAEYQAFIYCLDALLARYSHPELMDITVYSDSKNMVKQLLMEYRTRSELLRGLHAEAKKRIDQFKSVDVVYISREDNVYTDALVTEKLQTLSFK